MAHWTPLEDHAIDMLMKVELADAKQLNKLRRKFVEWVDADPAHRAALVRVERWSGCLDAVCAAILQDDERAIARLRLTVETNYGPDPWKCMWEAARLRADLLRRLV